MNQRAKSDLPSASLVDSKRGRDQNETIRLSSTHTVPHNFQFVPTHGGPTVDDKVRHNLSTLAETALVHGSIDAPSLAQRRATPTTNLLTSASPASPRLMVQNSDMGVVITGPQNPGYHINDAKAQLNGLPISRPLGRDPLLDSGALHHLCHAPHVSQIASHVGPVGLLVPPIVGGPMANGPRKVGHVPLNSNGPPMGNGALGSRPIKMPHGHMPPTAPSISSGPRGNGTLSMPRGPMTALVPPIGNASLGGGPMNMPNAQMNPMNMTALNRLSWTLQHARLVMEEREKQEERKRQRRAANKHAAVTSRARKKQQLDQMMEQNRSLKKEARILDLLPDIVICVEPTTGRINFASKSCGRKLMYKSDLLAGTSLFSIVSPESHNQLRALLNVDMTHDLEINEDAEKCTHNKNGSSMPPTKSMGSSIDSQGPPSVESGSSSSDDGRSNSINFNDSSEQSMKFRNFTPKTNQGSASSSCATSFSDSSAITSISNLSDNTDSSSSPENCMGSVISNSSSNESFSTSSEDKTNGSTKFEAWSQQNVNRHNQATMESVSDNDALCVLRKDGTKAWCEVNVRPYQNDKNTPPEIILSFRPVEAALIQHEVESQ